MYVIQLNLKSIKQKNITYFVVSVHTNNNVCAFTVSSAIFMYIRVYLFISLDFILYDIPIYNIISCSQLANNCCSKR